MKKLLVVIMMVNVICHHCSAQQHLQLNGAETYPGPNYMDCGVRTSNTTDLQATLLIHAPNNQFNDTTLPVGPGVDTIRYRISDLPPNTQDAVEFKLFIDGCDTCGTASLVTTLFTTGPSGVDDTQIVNDKQWVVTRISNVQATVMNQELKYLPAGLYFVEGWRGQKRIFKTVMKTNY